MQDPAGKGEEFYRGIPVSPGVCRGKALVLSRSKEPLPRWEIAETDLDRETERLENALVRTRQQILDVQRQVAEKMGAADASIFEAHLLVLEDHTLLDEVTRLMREERINAESAFHQVSEKYAATLSSIEDEYLRERANDMRDVAARVLNNLMERPHHADLRASPEPCILVAEDISPSFLATIDRKKVLGVATDVGSKTSHTAIIGRSLRMPAVVGLQDVSKKLQNGSDALLDAYNGLLIIHPSDQTLFEYGQLAKRHVDFEDRLRELRDKPAVTLDGARLILSANLEQPSDAELVIAAGSEGVGLFRTEYLFLNRQSPPSEEEQYEAYCQVAKALNPNPVVVRTLDLGGDKLVTHLELPPEMNPFLGWRAIRFCLQEHDLFRQQLRAILRASVAGNIKLMYPMISCLSELEQANGLVEQYKAELRCEGAAFNEQLEIGMMVEVPSAALIAPALAKRVKFFSIGTNDLIQYSLAVDRLNQRIAHLYQPTHPAIVHLIKTTVDAAHQNRIWAGVCGEMAADPALVPLLIGLGVDELSVTPSALPQIKYLIRRLKTSETRDLADFALNSDSAEEILARSQALAKQAAAALFE